MRQIACAMALAAASCGSGGVRRPPRAESAPALHRLEARRSFAVAQLIGLAKKTRRDDVTRGLGRVGGESATEALTELLGAGSSRVRAAAARALGMIGDARAEAALLAAHARASDLPTRAAIAWALGRTGSASSVPVLVASLRADAVSLRREAAVALGMLGRRKIAARAPEVVDALLASASHVDAQVRYGVAYALARAHPPEPLADREAAALLRLARDADPEVSAVAISGLVRRRARQLPWELATIDRDFRVLVALAEAGASDRADHRAAVIAMIEALLAAPPSATRMHAVATGLRSLGTREQLSAADQAAARRLHARTTALLADHGAAVSQAHCLAAALAVRAGADFESILGCGGGAERGLPLAARRALAAKLLASGFGGAPTVRMGRLLALTSEQDARVRGAVLDALAKLAEIPSARGTLAGLAARALGDKEIEVAGAGAALAGALIEHGGIEAGTPLAAALIERGRRVTDDAELRVGVLGALARSKLHGGLLACRVAMGDPNVTVRAAGRACVAALTQKEPEPARPRAPPRLPPVDPAGVIGKHIRWRLRTSRGAIDIELDPQLAPWHVAVIVALTRRGFYDGLSWHRVVPGFVIQGGDPRGSGWGGPGFTVPGEPGGRFVRGTVGVADAGMDTGGSQFFIMHARAPHLDGRYTAIGRVRRGLEVVDAIAPGDRIVRAEIEITQPTRRRPRGA